MNHEVHVGADEVGGEHAGRDPYRTDAFIAETGCGNDKGGDQVDEPRAKEVIRIEPQRPYEDENGGQHEEQRDEYTDYRSKYGGKSSLSFAADKFDSANRDEPEAQREENGPK